MENPLILPQSRATGSAHLCGGVLTFEAGAEIQAVGRARPACRYGAPRRLGDRALASRFRQSAPSSRVSLTRPPAVPPPGEGAAGR